MGLFKKKTMPEPPLPKFKEDEQEQHGERELDIPQEVKDYIQKNKKVVPPPPIPQEVEEEKPQEEQQIDSDERAMLYQIILILEEHEKRLQSINNLLVDIWMKCRENE